MNEGKKDHGKKDDELTVSAAIRRMENIDDKNIIKDELQGLKEKTKLQHKQNENLIEYIKTAENTSLTYEVISKLKFLLIIFSFLTIVSILLIIFIPSSQYYNKSDLENRLGKIINNNGDIETIRHTYKKNINTIYAPVRSMLSKNIIPVREKPKLGEILMNLKANYYEMDDGKQIRNIKNLDLIIEEYNSTNPFDNLEENQKHLFNNVRNQSDSLYSQIEDNVHKIVDELEEKNRLVIDYLSHARSSHRNSIIAIILSGLSFLLVVFLNFRRLKGLKEISKEEELTKQMGA